jgi:hypothetical protein
MPHGNNSNVQPQKPQRDLKELEYTDRDGTVWRIDAKGDFHFVKKLPRTYKDWFKKPKS